MSNNDHIARPGHQPTPQSTKRKLAEWAGFGVRGNGLSDAEVRSLLRVIRDDHRDLTHVLVEMGLKQIDERRSVPAHVVDAWMEAWASDEKDR